LAAQRGVEVVTLEEEGFGLDWSFEVTPDGEVAVEQAGRDVSRPTGALVRLHPEPSVRDGLGISDDLHPQYASERRAAVQHLLDAVPFPVVNRPSAGRSNGSKPLQMAQLVAAGFAVPRWLVTNEAEAAREFVADCGDGAVVKAVSGLRSHVRWWNDVTLERLQAGTVPCLIQEYVPGCDVRVHVVDTRVFGSQVTADVVDYRFDTEHASYDARPVPDDIGLLCCDTARADGLLLAGLDFRVDSTDRWWCLEMNPVPTFLPYEAATGHCIGDAVVDLVCPGTTATDEVSPLARRLAQAFS
jgi:glutathione synthase/RimK-type ligase-like ATP-grasp enzyme